MPRRPRPAPLWLALAAALACDGGLEPEPICGVTFVGVCGTIQFIGAAPAETDAVYVVAYQTFPQTCDDLYGFRPFPPPSLPPPYAGAVPYSVSLSPGRYEWVLAVWKKQGSLTLTVADTALLREAGHYRDPATPSQPGSVTVSDGGTGGIDLTVDFANLHPVSDYFACTEP
ncbi:MAG: hypothetical protein ACREMJ_00495 [Gemmatimonadales bacterium]